MIFNHFLPSSCVKNKDTQASVYKMSGVKEVDKTRALLNTQYNIFKICGTVVNDLRFDDPYLYLKTALCCTTLMPRFPV